MTNVDDLQLIDDCMNRCNELSDWESGFLDSIAKRLGDGNSLTEKQANALSEIWDRVT